jgi:hypothetical protein
MPAVSGPSRQQLPGKLSRPRSRQAPAGQIVSDDVQTTLGHFDEITTMIALLEHSPQLADKIRRWRLQNYGERLAAGVAGARNDETLRAYRALSPLMQRAFRAVVEGIDKLAESAVDLYRRAADPPTPDQVNAGLAIGKGLRQLRDRAMALLEPSGAGGSPARMRQDPRSRQG